MGWRARGTGGLGLALLGLATLSSCLGWGRRQGGDQGLDQAVAGLIQEATRSRGDGRIAVVGFRDEKGGQSAASRGLDEYLASALVRSGLPLAPMPDSAASGSEEALVRSACGAGVGQALVGRLRADSAWAYARLYLVECGTGRLLGMGSRRVARQALLAAGPGPEEGPVAAEVELHLMRLHEEGGFARLFPLEEGGTLPPGDRLQIRFRVSAERRVWAFLYSSAGERVDLFPGSLVYPGRMQFGPGEEQWVTPEQRGQVYTLYFVVAPYLEEDQSELFDHLAERIGHGEVDHFTGLEKLDQDLVDFLRRHLQGSPPVAVQRGQEGVELGKSERFILDDGTALESRPERLRAAPVLVRAFSFLVQ